MSQTYKIYRWDSVLFGNDTDPTPIIYVKADQTVLDFAKANKNLLLVKLHVPGSIYDNKKVIGTWNRSSDIPNCRINFFEKTELYVIVLQAPWHGYPDCLGDCSIYGVEGGIKATDLNPGEAAVDKPLVKQQAPLRTPGTLNTGSVKSSKLPPGAIAGIIAAVLVVIGMVYIILK